MKTYKRTLIVACAMSVSVLAISALLLFLLHRPSLKVVFHWKQPADITYDPWGPYYVSVVEADLDWRGFPFYVDRNYLIYAGRDSGTPSYGHAVDFSFHCFPETDLPTFLSKALVDWSPEGVELAFPSGHRLFIPKKMFIGGR